MKAIVEILEITISPSLIVWGIWVFLSPDNFWARLLTFLLCIIFWCVAFVGCIFFFDWFNNQVKRWL